MKARLRDSGAMTTWQLICADVAWSHDRSEPPRGVGAQIVYVAARLPKMKTIATVLHRTAHAAGIRSSMVGSLVKLVNHALTGADIAHEAQIGPALMILHPTGIVIGPDVKIGTRCTVMQGVTLGSRDGGSPEIGDAVHLSPHACIIGPLTIGSHTNVGANAVVTHSFEAGNQVLVGAPAEVIG